MSTAAPFRVQLYTIDDSRGGTVAIVADDADTALDTATEFWMSLDPRPEVRRLKEVDWGGAETVAGWYLGSAVLAGVPEALRRSGVDLDPPGDDSARGARESL